MNRHGEIRAVNRHLILGEHENISQSHLLRRWKYRADSVVVWLPKEFIKEVTFGKF